MKREQSYEKEVKKHAHRHKKDQGNEAHKQEHSTASPSMEKISYWEKGINNREVKGGGKSGTKTSSGPAGSNPIAIKNTRISTNNSVKKRMGSGEK